MSLRLEFVELSTVEGSNVALLCRRFGISRKTGYKWLARYRSGGQEALADRSRRPHRSPGRTQESVVQQIVALRQKHRAWGGRKLQARLKRLGQDLVPAASTITEILRRHELLDLERSRQHLAPERFEYANPNDLWQMDFKGHVALSGGGRCHPLTALDDHSRYALILQACGDESRPTVWHHLTEAFRRYGLPKRMLMDNGGPWGTAGNHDAWSRLEVWLMRLGIRVMHGRAMHPQTQGKEERFHQTLVAEVLRWQQFRDLVHAQEQFDPWREIYNHQRPHEALGMQVPGQRYQPSKVSYPESLPTVEYPTDSHVRHVGIKRCIKFQTQEYRIGRAFVGQPVALRATRVDGLWDVYYCQQRIGQIDQRDGVERTLRASRPLAALASETPGA